MSKSTACIVAAFANQPSRNFTTDPMGWLPSDQDGSKFEKFKAILKSPGNNSGRAQKFAARQLSP
jgi:ribonuclease D